MAHKILFFHIPRTSGKMIIENFFKPTETLKLSPKKTKFYLPMQFSVYHGHIPFGYSRFFNNCSYKTKWDLVTFLREPISRWISCFNYTIGHKKNASKNFHYRNKMWDSCNHNIVEFMTMCIKKDIGTNIIVKQLGGGLGDFGNTCSGGDTTRAYIWGKRKTPTSKENLRRFYRKAIRNISFFKFVGSPTVDSHMKFCKKFGVKYVPKISNSSKQTVDIDWNNSLIQEMLREINKYDIKLWKMSKEKGYVV